MSLPSPLGECAGFLQRWHKAVTGDPGALEGAARSWTSAAGRVRSTAGDLCSGTDQTLSRWTRSDASCAFGGRSSQLQAGLTTVASGMDGAGAALSASAAALRAAEQNMRALIARFTAAANRLVQSMRAGPPQFQAARVRMFNDQARALSESALAEAKQIGAALGQSLSSSAAAFTASAPSTGLFHRTFNRLLGSGSRRYPWEKGFNYGGDRLGYVAAGAPTTAVVSASLLMSDAGLPFRAALLRGMQRIPGSSLGDLLMSGALDPNVTGVSFLSDPTSNRLLGDTLSAAGLTGLDRIEWEIAKKIEYQRLLRSGSSMFTMSSKPGLIGTVNSRLMNLHSTLRPWALGAMPFTVDGANALTDLMVTKPAQTDENNSNYHLNIWGHSVATGIGVGGPVLAQTKNPRSAAIAVGAVTLQGLFGKYALGPPPPNPDPVYNFLHGAGTFANDVGQGYEQMRLNPIGGPSEYLGSSAINAGDLVVKPVFDAAMRSMDPSIPVKNLIHNWNNEPIEPLFTPGVTEEASAALTRSRGEFYNALHQQPVSAGDRVVSFLGNGFSGVGHTLTGISQVSTGWLFDGIAPPPFGEPSTYERGMDDLHYAGSAYHRAVGAGQYDPKLNR
jgi:uncharacterized protein YukE